ncbi:AraC family transcriptional regulator [Paenibacillus koleovorans]|uniref:AraC family transcriptional regulator n=1 Tax=Paenibacillus koleovorans TaxID=121608 RepID=UPI0013E3DA9C|nr:AraC family transcriptional regulator [Paenibacillus koleovorans]
METRQNVFRGTDFFQGGLDIYVNRAVESFEMPFHAHDFIEVTLVSEGRGYHHIGHQVQAVGKGDLFVLPAGVPHVFRPASVKGGDKLVVCNCLFSDRLLTELTERLLPDLELAPLLRLQPGHNDHGFWVRDRRFSFEPLFAALYREYNGERRGSSAMLYALLIQLLVELYRATNESRAGGAETGSTAVGIESSKSSQLLIEEAIDYVLAHAAEPLTIRGMAERLRMSERHFFRLFKQTTGQPFHDFVQHARIRMSCELLLGTTQKVRSIAETVGYSDAESFYRAFRRIVGMTPGEFRKGSNDGFVHQTP